MNPLDHPLYPTLKEVCPPGQLPSQAPIVLLTSPFTRAGTSYVARDFALLAAIQIAPMGGRVALVDLDLNQQAQGAYFDLRTSQMIHGALAGPYDATFGALPFWQVSPDTVGEDDKRDGTGQICGLYLVGESGVAITRFSWNSVREGQTVHVVKSPGYWLAARNQFSLVVVDTPAFDRSDVALNVIPSVDQTILVSPSTRAHDPALSNLSSQIAAVGGTCAGMIVNAGVHSMPMEGTAG